ncbi:uncharacterized protein L3040_002022 [Drepanopeziza brunnea f. sp. 'multigermtubi']|uniref:Uncharacterized protein n=1 Tax=Marssonina brunnea f. sp. multigermtubi (strain MB_m1) TaxID=1072389 RepID=K1WPZ7_MARBU|nr:uncharacterized protein MBM_01587 [Drepanopeziza brunnea f. sp. 'multigermtubi' MB_m1]EKD19635.1 hypothetical protein MBM_01587 [Drepanopeziza brunnea f. sp. 'multigermtubi' MB_m1]KAJ5052268.1 hypothetical protein L3040_002022 [Drepanopeziza brunnea f. sp. 'multigermtubi']
MVTTRAQYRAQVIATNTMTRAQTRSMASTGHPIARAARRVRRRAAALPPPPPPIKASADQIFWRSRTLSAMRSAAIASQASVSAALALSPTYVPGSASAALGVPVQLQAGQQQQQQLIAIQPAAINPPAAPVPGPAYRSPYTKLPSPTSAPSAPQPTQPQATAPTPTSTPTTAIPPLFPFGIGHPLLAPTHVQPTTPLLPLASYRRAAELNHIIKPYPTRTAVGDFRSDLVRAIARQDAKRVAHLCARVRTRRSDLNLNLQRGMLLVRHRLKLRCEGRGWDHRVREKRRCLKGVERAERLERGEKGWELARVWEGSWLRAVESVAEVE